MCFSKTSLTHHRQGGTKRLKRANSWFKKPVLLEKSTWCGFFFSNRRLRCNAFWWKENLYNFTVQWFEKSHLPFKKHDWSFRKRTPWWRNIFYPNLLKANLLLCGFFFNLWYTFPTDSSSCLGITILTGICISPIDHFVLMGSHHTAVLEEIWSKSNKLYYPLYSNRIFLVQGVHIWVAIF